MPLAFCGNELAATSQVVRSLTGVGRKPYMGAVDLRVVHRTFLTVVVNRVT